MGASALTVHHPALAKRLLPAVTALVVAELDRLARSLRDAKGIVDQLSAKHVKLSIGGLVHHPFDPVGGLFFHLLAMVAELEFEPDKIRASTRDGMQVAKAKRTPPRGGAPTQAATGPDYLQLRDAGNDSMELEVL